MEHKLKAKIVGIIVKNHRRKPLKNEINIKVDRSFINKQIEYNDWTRKSLSVVIDNPWKVEKSKWPFFNWNALKQDFFWGGLSSAS